MLKNYLLANMAAATEDSIFALNSITKVFTAVAVLQLAEDREFSIDDPISRH